MDFTLRRLPWIQVDPELRQGRSRKHGDNPAINSISACIADLPCSSGSKFMPSKPRSNNPAPHEQSVTIDRV
jgi:hypothetical protein